ncbi:hypothetical protein [Phragmitibacter flavus]|nr:hypothetical protein [Phragmitibacter flavus]
MHQFSAFALLCIALLIPPSSASGQQLWISGTNSSSIPYQPHHIGVVDLSTGNISQQVQITGLGANEIFTDIAWDPSGNTLWGLSYRQTPSYESFVYQINHLTGAATLVDSITGYRMQSLAIDALGEMLYMAPLDSAFLTSYDIVALSFTTTPLSAPLGSRGDMVFGPGGALYSSTLQFSSPFTESIVAVDPVDGTVTSLINTGGDPQLYAMAWMNETSDLLAIGGFAGYTPSGGFPGGAGQIYSLDPLTGTITYTSTLNLAGTGFSSFIGGASVQAPEPSAGFLVMVAGLLAFRRQRPSLP